MTQSAGRCLVDTWTLELAGALIDRGLRSLRIRALDDSMMSGMDGTQDAISEWADWDDYFSAVANPPEKKLKIAGTFSDLAVAGINVFYRHQRGDPDMFSAVMSCTGPGACGCGDHHSR